MPMVKTTFVNKTTHTLVFKVSYEVPGLGRTVCEIPPMKRVTFEVDTYADYGDYWVFKKKGDATEQPYLRHRISDDYDLYLCKDDFVEYAEISISETIKNKFTWEGIVLQSHRMHASSAFNTVRESAQSRIKAIEVSCASLEKSLKLVKICPNQCGNLVQKCLKGIRKIINTYKFKLSESKLWQLFESKKLGQLASSLDRLLYTLESTKDLVKACGSQWCKMGLVVSIPVSPPQNRTLSKFDLLITELRWNLSTSYYALGFASGEFLWDKDSCTYVPQYFSGGFELPSASTEADADALVRKDRDHFLAHFEDGSLLTPENSISRVAHGLFNLRFAADRWKLSSAGIIRKRILNTSILSNRLTVPDCFWIENHLDLKIGNKLYGAENTKGIYRGEWCGQEVAISRTVYKENRTKTVVEEEAAIMLRVQHPNVVDFFGCAFTDIYTLRLESGGSDEICAAGYLVMELMQEDLRHAIDQRARIQGSGSPFPLAVAVDILLQIVAAMIHMHSRDIMHRDLKAKNCMVSPRSPRKRNSQGFDFYTVKLIDFGNSKLLNSDRISEHTLNQGTRKWMAPEVWGTRGVVSFSSYSMSADVYSFGMVCFEVVTGLFPFDHITSASQLWELLKNGYRPLIPPSVSCPEGLKELMKKCWHQNPMARPEFKGIQEELWTIKCELEVQPFRTRLEASR